MTYLTDHRGDLRADPRNLLPEAQTILCVGKLYNTPGQSSGTPTPGKISRYAWGEGDYHDVLRRNLNQLAACLEKIHGQPFAWRACIDSAPLLERSYAHAAGLGWIGKNTCLINQQIGSWFFLGELLLSVPLAPDSPSPFRCGSCSRCIDACPTEAIIPAPNGGWSIDSNLCISYLTIEKRGVIGEKLAGAMGNHLFGCDICQDVCPWNCRAPFSDEEQFVERVVDSNPSELASLTSDEFRTLFRHSPVWRAKYEGFLRNLAIAWGNSGNETLKDPLKRLAKHSNPMVAATAIQALSLINEKSRVNYRPSDANADS
jgi:epoxyqueuosine reductase